MQALRLGIIGVGLIGGSLAKDLKLRGFANHVFGVDLNKENLELAKKIEIVDRHGPLTEVVKNVDIIVIATPVNVISKILPTILDLISDDVTVTDMGSTKKAIALSVKGHPKRDQYVASHPMAGTENSGAGAALSGLFDHKAAVICDQNESSDHHLNRVRLMYQTLKMRIIEMTSFEHDQHAAFVSHLSHISSFVLATTVLDKEKNKETIFNLAGGGFESTVRLAKSSPEMWAPIFEQNREDVLIALEAYREHLDRFYESLKNENYEETKKIMEESNKIRKVLSKINTNSTREES